MIIFLFLKKMYNRVHANDMTTPPSKRRNKSGILENRFIVKGVLHWKPFIMRIACIIWWKGSFLKDLIYIIFTIVFCLNDPLGPKVFIRVVSEATESVLKATTNWLQPQLTSSAPFIHLWVGEMLLILDMSKRN